MRRLLALFALSVLFAAAPASAQPSFDCARASTPVEFTICEVPVLAQLDLQLAGAYGAARATSTSSEKRRIRDEQVGWIRSRDRCGSDAACLEASMRARLAALQGSGDGGGTTAGLSGIYCTADGSDTLLIEDHGTSLDFSFSTYQSNGHSCGAGAYGVPATGTGYSFREAGCTFTIMANEAGVVLSSSGEEGCRSFCGARALITEHVFPFAGRRPLPAGWISAEESGGC